MPKYAIVSEASKHCWSKNFMNIFKNFFRDNADIFIGAPLKPSGEQNLEYYSLYQQYLRLYEDTLSEYISSLDISITDFYRELQEVMDDKTLEDKKLLHFANYLVASTEYDKFYLLMARTAKNKRNNNKLIANVNGEIVLGTDPDLIQTSAESKSGESKDDDYDAKGGNDDYDAKGHK